ncbi:MAG: pimeloyl-ACP methyl ester carboxylesterase [Vicingaceae bacterium]|jgi:pimeloyl-ACP methyl ester carboxylesterase
MLGNFVFRGANISYTVKGKGRSILLIHGFLACKEIWKDYDSRLAKHFRVVTLDLPGHGESECIGYVHNMELLAECIKKLLQLLVIRKTIVVGHSLGGYVGLAFAENYPDSVLGLLMVNSSAKGDSEQRKKSRVQLIDLVKKDKNRAIELLVPSFFTLKSRKTTWQVKSYLRMAKKCSEQAIIATVEGMKIRKEREIILKFAQFKYHYIIGLQDAILNLQQLKLEANMGAEGDFTIIADASHMSLIETKEQVFKTIKLFSKR